MKKIFDYLFLLRPSIMIALWTFYFAGVYIALRINNIPLIFNTYNVISIIIILFLYSLLMGSVYIINQIVDMDTDKINKKLFILSENHISVKNAKIYLIILFLISIIGISFYSHSNIQLIILFYISYIMGFMYSVKPFILKRRPFLDLLANTIGYALIALIIGYLSTGFEFPYKIFLYAIPYVFAMSAIFINTTIMDYEGDKKVGANTTAIFLGIKKSAILSSMLMFFAAISAFIIKDYLVLVVALYSFIIFIIAYYKMQDEFFIKSVKYTAPVLTLFLSIVFYYFLIINIIVFFAMKIYYKKRFNIKYP